MLNDDFLDNPTKELIQEYIGRFESNDRYKHADRAIIQLFTQFPDNTSLEEIILKVSVINELYSTSIYSVFRMAQHILQCDIDKDIRNGDHIAIAKIATGHNIRTQKHNTEINFYSFATKYCHWHKQNHYSIYDSFVEKTLLAYKARDSFSNFKKKDLKDFQKFQQVILDFIKYYDLEENLAEADKFLWIYGKDKFPPNYKKAK